MASSLEFRIADFGKKCVEGAEAHVQKVVLNIYERIIVRSPVAAPETWKEPRPHVGGAFRQSWAINSQGIVAQGPLAEGQFGPGRPVQIGNRWSISNPMPYARRLEYGWSQKQAPHGFVRLTLIEFDSVFTTTGGRT
jgi:hypothetical protein